MIHISQINPPIPVITPKGKGLAYFIRDYGPHSHDMWTVCINGEFWSFLNPEIRAVDLPSDDSRGILTNDANNITASNEDKTADGLICDFSKFRRPEEKEIHH